MNFMMILQIWWIWIMSKLIKQKVIFGQISILILNELIIQNLLGLRKVLIMILNLLI